MTWEKLNQFLLKLLFGHSTYSDIVKKNKSLSQIYRLQHRAKARAEQSHVAEKVQTETVMKESETEAPVDNQENFKAAKALHKAEKPVWKSN